MLLCCWRRFRIYLFFSILFCFHIFCCYPMGWTAHQISPLQLDTPPRINQLAAYRGIFFCFFLFFLLTSSPSCANPLRRGLRGMLMSHGLLVFSVGSFVRIRGQIPEMRMDRRLRATENNGARGRVKGILFFFGQASPRCATSLYMLAVGLCYIFLPGLCRVSSPCIPF